MCAQAADPLGHYVVLPGLTLMMNRQTLHPQSEKGLVRRSSDPQGQGLGHHTRCDPWTSSVLVKSEENLG